jgi:hypothetical protein
MDKAWAEAARRCRLSPAHVRMAKELDFKPRSLLNDLPSPQQPWKTPVAEWVRELYAKRQCVASSGANGRRRQWSTWQTRTVQWPLRQRRETSDDSPAPVPHLS